MFFVVLGILLQLATPCFAQVATGPAGTGTVTSVTCNGAAITTTGTCSTVGQIPGTTTNDSASAGNVGEFITQNIPTGSSVAMTSGTPKTIASISLTAGDWDCRGVIAGNPAGTTTTSVQITAISTVNNTLPTVQDNNSGQSDAALAAGAQSTLSVGPTRLSLSGSATAFLVGQFNFAVSTLNAFGSISCRRVR